MRELKWRMWDKENNKWDYFTLESTTIYANELHKHLLNGDEPYLYIGLHDKNGKEIYEGNKFIFIAGYYKAKRNQQLTDTVVFRNGAFVGDKTQGVLTGYDQLEIIGTY